MHFFLKSFHAFLAAARSDLQVDEEGDVEEEGEDGDGGDVHGQVLPAGRRPQVDSVLVWIADGKVALEGQRHNHEDGGAHGDVGQHVGGLA